MKLYYVELHNGTCGLREGPIRNIQWVVGTENIRLIRQAKNSDVQWITAMGGRKPEDSSFKPKRKGEKSTD